MYLFTVFNLRYRDSYLCLRCAIENIVYAMTLIRFKSEQNTGKCLEDAKIIKDIILLMLQTVNPGIKFKFSPWKWNQG